ncbi:halocyanin domain-containing protein [Haloarcula sp. Atlit-7R]|uniref:halocyanin domain-containing protein n=1 Tax=Haloarcula sp. Atlit-7R TaxID=2282125 RepID=UPI000EF17516|nr:halocyanin domain-containing protein [Haloarcula sp. Atlit-7R]RLM95237.1 halocyanin domain-containing protein [Haloarcula sp. Atlit-7R]
MTSSYSRRALLRTAGVAVAGAVAGCGGDSTAQDVAESSDDTPSPKSTPADTPVETGGSPSVDEFLSETDNYNSIVDKTGSDSVTVNVGVEANGAYFGFGPAAIRVDSGTTVTWEWTGQGSTHNVVAQHGTDFASEQKSQEGATYTQTFDEAKTVLYVCVPHEGVGMKGAIVVE